MCRHRSAHAGYGLRQVVRLILRDFACSVCGHVLLDRFVEADELSLPFEQCPECGCTHVFAAVCNGGLRSRWRFADWPSDPEFYRGQTTVAGVEAVDSYGEPVRQYTSGTREIGEPMHDAEKYRNGSDERETKRDKIQHATRRSRGKSPIVCDLGKKE